jgi:hypothetical protein
VQNEYAERISKPFWYSKLLVEWPTCTVFMTVAVVFTCVALTILMGLLEMTKNSEREYLIVNNTASAYIDANLVATHSEDNFISDSSAIPERTQIM